MVNIKYNNLFFNDLDISIILDDIQYQYYLKIISYKIESPIMLINKQLNQDKSNTSGAKSSENSNSGIKIYSEPNTKENINYNKNYMKLIFTLQPNTFDGTKLLTITMIDYSEVLNEEQIKNIIQNLFKNFEEILINIVPLTKNSESIIIDANINIVFDFWATWKVADVQDGMVSDMKIEGDPKKVGTKLNYIYFKKYPISAEILEVNKYIQEGEEDDNNEWNYKYKVTFTNGQSETLNSVFVSCENGSKTWVSVENDINEKIGIAKLQELSKRKLIVLNGMKGYIEKNKELLVNLYNSNKIEN